jgi:hypothetical protein
MLRHKIYDGKQSTSAAGHFNSHGLALVQYKVLCLMQHVQGYTVSHCMPPLGNYSLHIALVAARVQSKTTTIKKCTKFVGHFDGRGSALVQYRLHCLMEEVQGFTKSHWLPPLGKYLL